MNQVGGRVTKSTISIRRAWLSDIEAVQSILLEAAHWLEAEGEPLWREEELSTELLADDVQAGLYYLAECDGTPVGTVKFQLSDEETWPDAADGEPAFMHRLAVKRSHSGGEVSTALLDFGVERTAALGRRYLRLDCERRPKLQAVYEGFGFRWHSDFRVGPYHVARYELLIEQR